MIKKLFVAALAGIFAVPAPAATFIADGYVSGITDVSGPNGAALAAALDAPVSFSIRAEFDDPLKRLFDGSYEAYGVITSMAIGSLDIVSIDAARVAATDPWMSFFFYATTAEGYRVFAEFSFNQLDQSVSPNAGIRLVENNFGGVNRSEARARPAVFTTLQHDVIIPPLVPEPASWALMVAGFGLAGAALRSRARSALA